MLSIVVVVYRSCEMLKPLLESIFANKTEETEVIVIDGGSDDGTAELLNTFRNSIDFWSIEADNGIYDAMNKGLQAATGHFVLHLNAGDRLRHVPSRELLECVANKTDVACFRVLMNGWYVYRPRKGLIMKLDNSWHHQGTFYRRASHPGYDAHYRVYGDFDVNQRLTLSGASVEIFDTIVSEHTTDGASSGKARRHEIYEIIQNNFGGGYLALARVRFLINAVRYAFKLPWERAVRVR